MDKDIFMIAITYSFYVGFHTYHNFLGVFTSTYHGIYTKLQETMETPNHSKVICKNREKQL